MKPHQRSLQTSCAWGASDAQCTQPHARLIPHSGIRELGLSCLLPWLLSRISKALKSRIVLRGDGSSKQTLAMVCWRSTWALASQAVLLSLAERLQRCQRINRNWPAFKMSSQGLLNHLPCLCTPMSVCLVICSTLCTLCSSYRLAFSLLQQFPCLCQHLAICSFNAY